MREPDRAGASHFARRALTLSLLAAAMSASLVVYLLESPAAAQSTQTIARQSPQQKIVGKDCQQCHRLIVQTFPLDAHGKSAKFLTDSRSAKCDACHRNSDNHTETSTRTKEGQSADSPANPSARDINESCLMCHARDRSHFQWSGGQHDRKDMSCLSCHSIHHTKLLQTIVPNFADRSETEVAELVNTRLPEHLMARATIDETCLTCHFEERKALYQRSTHLFRTEERNVKVGCTACHNPHGGEGKNMLVDYTVNNVCYTCHAEKRGPFLWEHPPVRENCMNCHAPHGSNNPKLLQERVHLLCQECHIHMLPRHSTMAGQALDIWSFNRGCSNCHSQVHGSNHPGGRTFTR